jgi:hypothetical protein
MRQAGHKPGNVKREGKSMESDLIGAIEAIERAYCVEGVPDEFAGAVATLEKLVERLPAIRNALSRAEGFMSGFEDEPDFMSPDDLAAVRAALAALAE